MFIEQILLRVPCPIFWKDLNGKFLGCNELFLQVAKLKNYSEFIGKTDWDFDWKDHASEYIIDDQHVVATGETITRVEEVPMPGRVMVSETTKTPLMEDGKIVGVLGICYDITDRIENERLQIENEAHLLAVREKELENLRLENELQKTQLEALKRFRTIVDQVAHDIRSPLATMNMVLAHCDTLPENLRVTLNQSATRIFDIASNLLNAFNFDDEAQPSNSEHKVTLISTAVLEIVTEKKYEYSDGAIDFITTISSAGYFSFINVVTKNFKRAISNLINNAVESFAGASGTVKILLDVVDDKVQVVIEDNGSGMTKSVCEKILNSEIISSKIGGHGIGYDQVRNMLSTHDGELAIESEPGIGTKVILHFIKAESPDWIANNIELREDNLVVILDDDPSIHGAWAARFNKVSPSIQHKHFEQGIDTINFINELPTEQKDKVFLLTDYELLKQGLNGLDVITQTNVKHSILVTSHHNNQEVRKLARSTNTLILPKPLAANVPIVLRNVTLEAELLNQQNELSLAQQTSVDLVIIDDDKLLIDTFMRFLFKDMQVDIYSAPEEFLAAINKYPKNTKIAIDNHYNTSKIVGVDLARQLHTMNFTNLYVLSGDDPKNIACNGFATAILKTDLAQIKQFLSSNAN